MPVLEIMSRTAAAAGKEQAKELRRVRGAVSESRVRSNQFVLARLRAERAQDSRPAADSVSPEDAAASLLKLIEADPTDRLGRMRRWLQSANPAEREKVLARMRDRSSETEWSRLTLLLAEPAPPAADALATESAQKDLARRDAAAREVQSGRQVEARPAPQEASGEKESEEQSSEAEPEDGVRTAEAGPDGVRERGQAIATVGNLRVSENGQAIADIVLAIRHIRAGDEMPARPSLDRMAVQQFIETRQKRTRSRLSPLVEEYKEPGVRAAVAAEPAPIEPLPPAERAVAPEAPSAPEASAPEAVKEAVTEAMKEKEALPSPDEGAAAQFAAGTAGEADIQRAPSSPAADPEFQNARSQIRAEAKKQRRHDPAAKKRTETEAASALDEPEQTAQSSRDRNTTEMEKVGAAQQGQKFSADDFIAEFKRRVEQARPETEGQAKAFAQKPPVEHLEEDFSKEVAAEQGRITTPLLDQSKATPTGVVDKEAVELRQPVFPPAPNPVDSRLASPKAKTDEETSLHRESERLDQAMVDNRLTDDQLAESREPEFEQTLAFKQETKQKIAEAPGVYRQAEADILMTAEGQAQESMSTELEKMGRIHPRVGRKVFKGQGATETRTERRQREIKEARDGIYDRMVGDVQGILNGLASKFKQPFIDKLGAETKIFNDAVSNRIRNYYGRFRLDDEIWGPSPVVVEKDGSYRSLNGQEISDLFRGKDVKIINPDVYNIFLQEKKKFVDAMELVLREIASGVQTDLKSAHDRIQRGRKEWDDFKAPLKADELEYAELLEDELELKFANLEASIDDAREDLLQTLADEYSAGVNQLEKKFNEIHDELKKSWVDRAIELVKTVAKTIFQLAELLFTILSRVAHLVWDIIKHPIRFFETLVSGLKQGIGEFVGNIGVHMQEAFWGWITGATPVKTIRLSIASGVESLFDLVIQVLSLGPADLRLIVEKVLGKEFMQTVDKGIAFGERALEPVVILLKQGPVAFWRYLQETLGSVVKSAFDRIKDTVFYAFIEKALKWVAGFFVPGGGFVKIVKAVFAAFQFVAANLENIKAFFDSVFDSMESATQGSREGVAGRILTGLKIGVALALDFLARQLGFEKIIDGVQKIIQSLKRPIVNAVEMVLRKLKPLVQKLLRKLGVGGKEQPPADGVDRRKGAYDGQIGKVVTFSAAGESHRLWITQRGTNALAMMSSASKPVLDQLAQYEQLAALRDETKQRAVMKLIAEARRMLGVLDSEADTLAKHLSTPGQNAQQIEREDQTVEGGEERLAAKLAQIRETLGIVEIGKALEPILVKAEAEFLRRHEQMREEELFALDMGLLRGASPEDVPYSKEIADIASLRRIRSGEEGLVRSQTFRLRSHGVGITFGGLPKGVGPGEKIPGPLLSAASVPVGRYSSYEAMREYWARVGAPEVGELGPGHQALAVLERGRSPGMLPAMDVALGLAREGMATTEEITLGALAPMAPAGAATAAEAEAQGRVVTGKEREVVEAARKQRHERIANIFLRLREILARPRSDVPVTAGANNLARLAAAFDRWLRAHVNPEIVGNSDTLRRAAAKLTRELIEFLKAFRV